MGKAVERGQARKERRIPQRLSIDEKSFARHNWYYWATHSKLNPMIAAAKTIQRHFPNVLTCLRHRITNVPAEGLNSRIQMVKEMACGFRNREHYKTATYFHCGGLDLYPRPEESEPC